MNEISPIDFIAIFVTHDVLDGAHYTQIAAYTQARVY